MLGPDHAAPKVNRSGGKASSFARLLGNQPALIRLASFPGRTSVETATMPESETMQSELNGTATLVQASISSTAFLEA